jgi:DNA-binding transcriptional LysR family regulator
VERHGRGSRFTPAGESLLVYARRILAVHDEALRSFEVEPDYSLLIGSTEHVAGRLLPDLARSLTDALPQCRVRFRVDRGAELRQDLADGRVDLALLLASAHDSLAARVGRIGLTWYSSPDWEPPPVGRPVSLVAFDEPCVVRSSAMETLAARGIPAEVVCEAPHLAGVQAAIRAGLGVGLMATLQQVPDGIVPRHDLPTPQSLELSVWSRRGLPPDFTEATAASLRRLLTATRPAEDALQEATLAAAAC